MSAYQSWITTPEAIGRQLAKSDPGLTLTPAAEQWAEYLLYITDAIKELSVYLTSQTSRAYVPYRDTKLYYFRDIQENRRISRTGEMDLRADAQSITSVTWYETALTTDQYRLVYPEFEGNGDVAAFIKFDPANIPAAGSGFNDAISIAGVWGWHASTGQAFETIETITLADGTTTSITIASGGLSRYETRQYLRCENEFLQITAVANTALTVLRGVNGSTAAAHSSKALEVYRQSHEIDLIATNLGAFMYTNRIPVNDAVLALGENSAVSKMINLRRILTFGSV